jgi:flagellar biosynthetic protein FliP
VEGREYRMKIIFLVLILIFCSDFSFAQEKKEGLIPTQDFIKREDDPGKVVTRIVIVLSFIRRALATQELPPNQVIIGLSLILTFTIMAPTFRLIKKDALEPYMKGKISQEGAFKVSVHHLRQFMFSQTRLGDLRLFLDINKIDVEGGITQADVPTEVLVPAFVISELRRAFVMGFALFLPFMVIDLVVSTALVSMGMLVLPPILISLPFKILLFVLVDGWNLLIGSIVRSFNMI